MSTTWKSPLHVKKRYRVFFGFCAFVGPLVAGYIGGRLAIYPANTDVERSYWNWAENIATVATIIGVGGSAWIQKVTTGCTHKPYIDVILSSLHKNVWEKNLVDLEGGSNEHHRVTLFEVTRRDALSRFFRTLKIPFFAFHHFFGSVANFLLGTKIHTKPSKEDGWTHVLVPRARYPATDDQMTRRRFHVHTNREDLCEGFAGAVFHKGRDTVVSVPLPDMKEPVSDASLHEFAKNTFDDIEMVRKHKYKFRIIGGTAIRNRADTGRHWVLMFDSRDKDALIATSLLQEKNQRAFELLGEVLSIATD